MRVSANFPSGSIGNWRFDRKNKTLYFNVRLDGAPFGMWFYFRMERIEPGLYNFVLENLEECLGKNEWHFVRPVYRLRNNSWKRVPYSCIIHDNQGDKFYFSLKIEDKEVEIAYSYPYPPDMLHQLIDKLSMDGPLNVLYPGFSQKGRPIPYFILPKRGKNSSKGVIWLLARQHAGEVSGSYTLEGFLLGIAKSKLREFFEIHVLPMVDIDGVIEGSYGKLSPPYDHGDAWYGDTCRPEISLAIDLIRKSVTENKHLALLVDFHSPTPENRNYIYLGNPTLLKKKVRENLIRLAYLLAKSSPRDFPLEINEDIMKNTWNWYGDEIESVSIGHIQSVYKTLAVCIETSYHFASTGVESNPENCRRLGVSLVEGLERYFFDRKTIKKPLFNIIENMNWIFWNFPHNYLFYFKRNFAKFISDGCKEDALLYIASPKQYRFNKNKIFKVTYEGKSDLEIYWYFYDKNGLRLFEKKKNLIEGGNLVRGKICYLPEFPENAFKTRPGFRIKGPFKKLQIELFK